MVQRSDSELSQQARRGERFRGHRGALLLGGLLALTPLAWYPLVVHAATTPLLLGEQPWYKLLPHRLSDTSDLAVNVASGDLVVHVREMRIHGTGLDLQLDRYYNSEDTSAGLFGTWRLGTAGDVSLSGANYATFTGSSGFVAPFAYSNGVYTAPPGLNASLQSGGAGNCSGLAYTLTFNASGEQYCFDSRGIFQKDVDRNGDAIHFAYSNGQLTTLTDTQSRAVAVTYSDTGSIQRLTDSTGRYTAHTYTASNQLFTSTDANGKQTTYNYDANGLLSMITDPLGNETTFTYSVDNRHIATITYVTNNHSGTGPAWSFAYNSNETTVTDPNSHATKYYYTASGANAGTVSSVVDANGHSQASTYTPNDDAQTLTDGVSQVTQLGYDLNNNLTSIMAPASGVNQSPAMYSLTYNAPGQTFLPSSSTDPRGTAGPTRTTPRGISPTSTTARGHPAPGRRAASTSARPIRVTPQERVARPARSAAAARLGSCAFPRTGAASARHTRTTRMAT